MQIMAFSAILHRTSAKAKCQRCRPADMRASAGTDTINTKSCGYPMDWNHWDHRAAWDIPGVAEQPLNIYGYGRAARRTTYRTPAQACTSGTAAFVGISAGGRANWWVVSALMGTITTFCFILVPLVPLPAGSVPHNTSRFLHEDGDSRWSFNLSSTRGPISSGWLTQVDRHVGCGESPPARWVGCLTILTIQTCLSTMAARMAYQDAV